MSKNVPVLRIEVLVRAISIIFNFQQPMKTLYCQEPMKIRKFFSSFLKTCGDKNTKNSSTYLCLAGYRFSYER